MPFLMPTNPVVTVSGSNPIISTGGSTPIISIQNATVDQKGAVQLEDSLISTSIVKAATPNSVKNTHDHITTISGVLRADIDDKSNIGHNHNDQYYTESEIDTISGSLDAAKSNVGHLHDDRYYLESEVDTISGSLDAKIPDTIIDLLDTPNVYDTGKYLKSTTTGVEWAIVSGTGSSDVQTFLDLTDTPTTYSGHAGDYLKVSLDEYGLEYSDTQGIATTTVSGWSVYDATTYYTDFEHNLSTDDVAVFVIDTVTNKEVGVEDIEIINGNTIRVYITDNTSSLKINVITGGFGTSQIGVSPDRVIYVAKNGSDATETGGINNPFLTIQAAIDCVYTMWGPDLDFENGAVIKVAPGVYEEQIHSYNGIVITSYTDGFTAHHSQKVTVLYNTGVDSTHYPFRSNEDEGFCVMVGIFIKTMPNKVFGKILNGSFTNCRFEGGNFIERNSSCVVMFTACGFFANSYSGFYFVGTDLTGHRNILFKESCTTARGEVVLTSTHSEELVNFQSTLMEFKGSITLGGDWALNMQRGRIIGANADKRNIINTTSTIVIGDSLLMNGIHFVSEPSTFRMVNSNFEGWNIPTGEGDITAGVDITNVEYLNNIQHNGLNGEFKINNTIKCVGIDFLNNYRNIDEVFKASESGDLIKLGAEIYEANIIIPEGVNVVGISNQDTIVTSVSGTTVTLSGSLSSTFDNLSILSTPSGTVGDHALELFAGTHYFNNCIIGSTAVKTCTNTISVCDSTIVLKSSLIEYNGVESTTGSGIHRLTYFDGTAGLDFRDSTARMIITDTNSLTDASVFESTASGTEGTFIETHLLGNVIEFNTTSSLWNGNCYGYRAFGVGTNRNILTNTIKLQGGGGTGNGYWYVLDTLNNAGEIHSTSNRIEVTGFGNNYFGNIAAGDTLISHFDDVVASDGVIGSGTYSFVNSPSSGNLQMSGYIVNPCDHVVQVAKSGAQYISVKEALNSITDSSTNNRYVVTVGPGIYVEDNPIQLKPWVSVQSIASKETTMVIAQNTSSDLFIGCDKSFLNKLALAGATSAKLLNMSVPGEMSVTNVIVVDSEYGIYIGHKDATINVDHLYAQTYLSTIKEVVTVVSGTIILRGLTVLDSLAGPSTIETLVKGSGSSSHIIVGNIWSDSSNVTNGIYIDNSCDLVENSGYLENVTYGMRIGSGGGSLSAASTRVKSSQVYDLWIEDSSGVFKGHGCSLNRDKLNIATGANARSFGYDEYVDTIRILGDFSVGKEDIGNISQFGEGGSYEYLVKVKTYDGSNYNTLTTQSGISFPNTSTDSCIYVGSDSLFYGLNYNLTTAINYGSGSGSIIYEYYDANGSWLEFNIMNTLQAYSDIVDVFTVPGENYTLRFSQNIKSGMYESDTTASGIVTTSVDGVSGYWIRYRIASDIATSPEFTSIRAKGNYFIIRANGTRAYHGESRVKQIKALIIGATSAGTANEPLSISTNIIFPYTQNEMFQVGSDESVYGRFIIPNSCDLSCGLSYSYEFTNIDSPASDEVVHFTVTLAGITETDKFDGSVSETVIDDSTFTIAATDVAWSLYRKTTLKRFDFSGFKPGDVIYLKLQRMNDTPDTYGSSVCLSNHYIEFRSWQDGIQLKEN